MGLKDFFRKRIETPAAHSPSGDYWPDVASLCRVHVPTTIEFFRSHRAPRLEWAEPLYLELVEDGAIDALLAAAQANLPAAMPESAPPPVPVGRFGAWSVCATIFPSAADALFVQRCPGGRFENYIEGCLKASRQNGREWRQDHYAQWILLLDPPSRVASIHLYTQWSLDISLAWIGEAVDGMVQWAPSIIPTELFQESFYDFSRRMTLMDLEAVQEQRRELPSRTAKVLLLDSVQHQGLPDPFDPLSPPGHAGKRGGWIDTALEAHRIDCETLEAAVPLVLSAPKEFMGAIETHLRSSACRGLEPNQVSVIPEIELPAVGGGGAMVKKGKYGLRTFLGGGGLALAHMIESGQFSDLWKSGIRYLMLGQLGNHGARLTTALVERIAASDSGGIFEVVLRSDGPSSRLVVLHDGTRNRCIDDRRLASADAKRFRDTPMVATGTFWVSCEKLAEAFGISKAMLESPWNAADWQGKVMGPLMQNHSIIVTDDGVIGSVVPIWEALSELPLDAIRVGPERFAL